MTSSLVAEVKLLTAGVAPGDSIAGELCPACKGGHTKEKSFSVSRTEAGDILYCCHRASCPFQGVVADWYNNPSKKTATRAVGAFERPTTSLSREQINWFNYHYMFTESELTKRGRLTWVPERKSVAHPVFSPEGCVRGTVLRDYNYKTISTYRLSLDEPWLSWYRPEPPPAHRVTKQSKPAAPATALRGNASRLLVICEDILSAIKMSRQYRAVALLGTILNSEQIVEIRDTMKAEGFEKGVLLLDDDAWPKALAYVQRYSTMLPDLVALKPEEVYEAAVGIHKPGKDPKTWGDLTIRKVAELVGK